jgi:ATP-dependent protease ClpP protease subunit
MAKKILVMDGYITGWNISKQLVREFLKTATTDEVEVQLSSLGGEVSHAIDIYNQFQAHGNVTVIMSSFNASSSTLLALGAKKTVIHSNSFYLIHKPMLMVDAWSNMNADEMDQFIAKLEKDKKFLEKLTAELTKMYMMKTGKSSAEVLALMNESKWITATEAKDFGFVDEILTPDEAINLLDDRAVAMLTENDLPIPVMQAIPPVPVPEPTEPVAVVEPVAEVTEAAVDSIWTRIVDRVTALIHPQNHKKADMKIFALINALLSVPTLESADDKGVYLNEAQLQAIEDRLATASQTEIARQTAENALIAANTALDAIDPTVTSAATIAEKVIAIAAVIASKPGKKPTAPKADQDPALDKADWNTIDSLPHNKEYDELQ